LAKYRVAQHEELPVSSAQPTDAVAFHSEIASTFHASYTDDPNRQERIAVWRRVLARFVPKGELAYDIGCGSGMVTCEIAPYASRVTAIDGASGMLEIARNTVASRGLTNVEFRQAHLPIPEGHGLPAADIVISSSVIEYLDSVEQALLFIRGILKPGGVLVFSISNRNSIKRQAVRVFNKLTGRPRYFGLLKHFLSADDIRAALEKTGFVFVESEYFDSKDRINSILGRIFPKKYAANLILAVAKRP
jgi:SAM-dependent methyltransferase